MSFKRRVLAALGKGVLLEIGRGLELDVKTRMGVEEVRDALAKSKQTELMSRDFFPTESLQLFGFADDHSFGVLQSSFHWTWAVGVGSKIKDNTRYTDEVCEIFPRPQEPTETQLIAVAAAGRALRHVRANLIGDEEQGRKVGGPGLPDHLDLKDSRWFSTDCIEPPPVGS